MKPPSEPGGATAASGATAGPVTGPAAGPGDAAGRGAPAGTRTGAGAAAEVPAAREARRVSLVRGGPMLVEGPVEVVLEDGSTERSDRFTVALCTCRRSRRFPWCDTSHRRRVRGTADEHGDSPGGVSGSPGEGGSSSTG